MSCCLFDLVKRMLGRFQIQLFISSGEETGGKATSSWCPRIGINPVGKFLRVVCLNYYLFCFLAVQDKDKDSKRVTWTAFAVRDVLWVVCSKKILVVQNILEGQF